MIAALAYGLFLIALVMFVCYHVFLSHLTSISMQTGGAQDGEDGHPGSSGQDGMNGYNGQDGYHGVSGQDGIRGYDGVDGINGLDQYPYDDPVDGEEGNQGNPGKTGSKGKYGNIRCKLLGVYVGKDNSRECHLALNDQIRRKQITAEFPSFAYGESEYKVFKGHMYDIFDTSCHTNPKKVAQISISGDCPMNEMRETTYQIGDNMIVTGLKLPINKDLIIVSR